MDIIILFGNWWPFDSHSLGLLTSPIFPTLYFFFSFGFRELSLRISLVLCIFLYFSIKSHMWNLVPLPGLLRELLFFFALTSLVDFTSQFCSGCLHNNWISSLASFEYTVKISCLSIKFIHLPNSSSYSHGYYYGDIFKTAFWNLHILYLVAFLWSVPIYW